MIDPIYDLLVEINKEMAELNEKDAEGHIWYARFFDKVKKYGTACPACYTTGFILDDDDEDSRWHECSYCAALGYVPNYHLQKNIVASKNPESLGGEAPAATSSKKIKQ